MKIENELQQEVKKLVKRANQRILMLERKIKSDTIQVENLRNKLDTEYVKGWTKKGRIKFNKNLSEWQLQAIKKATSDFLKEGTTIREYKKEFEEKKKELGVGEEFTYEDYYYLQQGELDLYAWITRHIPPSKFDHILEYAIEKDYTQASFVDLIIKMSETLTNDEDTVKKIKQLYNKYVKNQ